MSFLFNKPRNAETAEIRARIFNVLPAASYQFEKLFGLLDIEYSDKTATACVECVDTPRLLLNRQFVEEYCTDDGDLFLLILHELHHVILGHTRLFPKLDYIDNIAFDAVINSMLCRTVGRSVGVRLFTATNSWDEFPARLLRPPPGWPGPIDEALAKLGRKEAKVIRLLYGEDPDDRYDEDVLTYHDIYGLLQKCIPRRTVAPLTLLGNHDGDGSAEDSLMTAVIRRIVEGWPAPPLRISGRDEGTVLEDFKLNREEKPGGAFTRAFTGLLKRCGIRAGRGSAVYRRELVAAEFVRESVLPNGRDRRIAALKSITGSTPLIYQTTDCLLRPRPRRVPVVHVYLDVSGSMSACLPHLTAACREPFRRGELKLFAFSTVVSEVKGSELMRSSFGNTQGTDINAVLRHAAAIPVRTRPKVMLIVTDGYVGSARAELVAALAGVRIVAALTDPGYEADLKPWISELNNLPKP
jgi:hypothetical protein